MDWPRPSYTFGHEERPQDPLPVRLTKNSIPKKPVGETGVEKRARTPSGFTRTPTLLMVVFGLASMVNDAFGEDISFVVVTKMAFMLLLHLLWSFLWGLHAFIFSLLFFQNAVK
jgi:hypothetical protein